MNEYQIEEYIQLSGPLFEAVQQQRVFDDSKQFVDMIPVEAPEKIVAEWRKKKEEPGFELAKFVTRNFKPEEGQGQETEIKPTSNCREHIRNLWPQLFRESKIPPTRQSSLITLPGDYVVPGGRFREIYYWDSYFTAQGLVADGHSDMVLAMTDNFRFLAEETGHIPNGNRVYYLSRSQPPFFVPMIELVASLYGNDKIETFLPAAEQEYRFWMDKTGDSGRRAVKISGGGVLNRYWDDRPVPREESWFEDTEQAEGIPESGKEDFYRHIRAACESGWDFSSRWMADGINLSTIETTAILPVDLNTLIWNMENKLSEWCRDAGRERDASRYKKAAAERKASIGEYMWDDDRQFFFDWNHIENRRTGCWSLAAVYPLYFGLADEEQAAGVANHLKDKFLRSGGLLTTTVETGQQWDAPNGWAPLQWLAVKGLQNYGLDELADEISRRWLSLNDNIYHQTGKMVEKYNVADLNQEGGGGEYPLQDGFGWSNGVYSALDDGKS